MVATAAGRAQESDVRVDRAAARARGGTGRARLHRRRQADHRVHQYRSAGHARYLQLVCGSDRQVLRPHRADRTRRAGPDRQGADRRGRRSVAVELPGPDVCMESRAGAGRRQFGGGQTGRTDIAERLPDDAAGASGRHSGRRADAGDRLGRGGRRAARAPSGCRYGVVYRLHRSRPACS